MITLAQAKCLLTAAGAKATELGQPMNIAVVDGGGALVAHVRMDRAWRRNGGVDVAIKKAWTARASDAPSEELAALARPGEPFSHIQAPNEGRAIISAGGIPLKRGDVVVGAIGVSGGTGKQDQAVAEAGAEAFKAVA